jgi:hypothetical protein
MRSIECLAATSVVLLATLVGGCKSRPAASSGAQDGGAEGAASAGFPFEGGTIARIFVDAGPAASGIPVAASKVEARLNPSHLPPYKGPTATLEGVVTASGDPPPKRDVTIPFACAEAYATYGKAFREGTGRTLADVMVTVTEYKDFVPAASDAQAIKIHGCAYDRRTVVMTYGQHLEVFNTGPKESFLPTLLGANMPAQMAALPHGDAVKLYPGEVGHYLLSDDAKHDWMSADVFVVPYSTHAVTGLDGHYRIEGIPPGKVKISMYAPAIDVHLHGDFGIASVTQEREIELKPDETTKVDFVLPYKTPKPRPKPKPEADRPIVK